MLYKYLSHLDENRKTEKADNCPIVLNRKRMKPKVSPDFDCIISYHIFLKGFAYKHVQSQKQILFFNCFSKLS